MIHSTPSLFPHFPSTREPPSVKQQKLPILPVLPRRKEKYTPKLMGTLCGCVEVKNGSLRCECTLHTHTHTHRHKMWGLVNNTASQSLASHQFRYWFCRFHPHIHITCAQCMLVNVRFEVHKIPSYQILSFRLISAVGTTSTLTGKSCKHIRSTLSNQTCTPQSGGYWVKVDDPCSDDVQTIQVVTVCVCGG